MAGVGDQALLAPGVPDGPVVPRCVMVRGRRGRALSNGTAGCSRWPSRRFDSSRITGSWRSGAYRRSVIQKGPRSGIRGWSWPSRPGRNPLNQEAVADSSGAGDKVHLVVGIGTERSSCLLAGSLDHHCPRWHLALALRRSNTDPAPGTRSHNRSPSKSESTGQQASAILAKVCAC